jgi:hypothetical protein
MDDALRLQVYYKGVDPLYKCTLSARFEGRFVESKIKQLSGGFRDSKSLSKVQKCHFNQYGKCFCRVISQAKSIAIQVPDLVVIGWFAPDSQ